MTPLALPALAAAVVAPATAVATLWTEGGSRRGLGMAGFLLLFGAAEAAAAVMHLTPPDAAPPLAAAKWSYVLGMVAYLPMIEFLGDLARRAGAERPLGIPLALSETVLRLLAVTALLLVVGGPLALSGLEHDGAWVRTFGPHWPVLPAIGGLYVVWAVACWDGERRRRGRVDSDQWVLLGAILLLTAAPILTSTLIPAVGLNLNPYNGVATVLGSLCTLGGLLRTRHLQLERLAPDPDETLQTAADADVTVDDEPTVEDIKPPSFARFTPIVLACSGCKALYQRLPEDAVCSQDGHPVQTGPDPLIGRVVAGRWRILGFLGAGGMARVYAAEHHRLGTRCAIKVIWGDLLDNEAVFQRFMREAHACQALSSPHIVRLQDVAELQAGLPLLVLELIEGESLDRLLSSTGPLPVDATALLGSQLAQGLADAHGAGIVHRDLKPANVMVTHGADRDVAKIVDFGLAKRFADPAELKVTVTGAVSGTPAYLAPEQIKGLEATPSADLYALGVLLYETLSGSRPFHGVTPQEICAKHLGMPPDPQPVSGPLGELIMGLLDKDPERRAERSQQLPVRLAALAGSARRFADAG